MQAKARTAGELVIDGVKSREQSRAEIEADELERAKIWDRIVGTGETNDMLWLVRNKELIPELATCIHKQKHEHILRKIVDEFSTFTERTKAGLPRKIPVVFDIHATQLTEEELQRYVDGVLLCAVVVLRSLEPLTPLIPSGTPVWPLGSWNWGNLRREIEVRITALQALRESWEEREQRYQSEESLRLYGRSSALHELSPSEQSLRRSVLRNLRIDLAMLAQMKVCAYQDHPDVREELRNASARLTHAAFESKLCDLGCVSDDVARRVIRYIIATKGFSHSEVLNFAVDEAISVLRGIPDANDPPANPDENDSKQRNPAKPKMTSKDVAAGFARLVLEAKQTKKPVTSKNKAAKYIGCTPNHQTLIELWDNYPDKPQRKKRLIRESELENDQTLGELIKEQAQEERADAYGRRAEL